MSLARISGDPVHALQSRVQLLLLVVVMMMMVVHVPCGRHHAAHLRSVADAAAQRRRITC